jgi:hypothetical protein
MTNLPDGRDDDEHDGWIKSKTARQSRITEPARPIYFVDSADSLPPPFHAMVCAFDLNVV